LALMPGEVGAQIAEPFRTEHQLAHDEQRPALADEIEGMRRAASILVASAGRRRRNEASYFL
jgi:hypothetical protein